MAKLRMGPSFVTLNNAGQETHGDWWGYTQIQGTNQSHARNPHWETKYGYRSVLLYDVIEEPLL